MEIVCMGILIHLFILAGILSEDMITTGMSFNDFDSCKYHKHFKVSSCQEPTRFYSNGNMIYVIYERSSNKTIF
ncbi:hypothetical protein HanIR_Chr11g0540561 [Helianthus annuus]|nr:hypothetical protein HanIR_Chr11g0540561 [Helianthus annuus]